MHQPSDLLLLEDALIDGRDGFVCCGNHLWHHFQRFPWDLKRPEANPAYGEHFRQIRSRITQGIPERKSAKYLRGEYHLGISPHMDNYYHLITDLLPHLIRSDRRPVLVPQWMPEPFKAFLQTCGFETKVLGEGIFQVEHLQLPAMPVPAWNLEKFQQVQDFIRKHLLKHEKKSPASEKWKRFFLSRRHVRRRHLVNEEELIPIFEKHRFRVLVPEERSIFKQIALFSQITHLITPHGAGLVNGIFCPKETRILEIRPIISSGDFCFDALFDCGNFRHEVLVPKKRGLFLLEPELLENILMRWDQEERQTVEEACA